MLHKTLHALYSVNLPVMIWGNPGEGKTEMVKKFAERMNKKTYLFYANKCEPSDIGGIPFTADIFDKDGNFVEKTVKHAKPDYIKLFEKEGDRNILFVDELTTCNPSIQGALLTVILDCNYGDFQIAKDTFRIGAGNYNNVIGTHKVNMALMNRFVHIFWKSKPERWASGFITGFSNSENAIINNYDGQHPDEDFIETYSTIVDNKGNILNTDHKEKVTKDLYYKQAIGKFVVANPQYFRLDELPTLTDVKNVAYPTPRTWEYVHKILTKLDRNTTDKNTGENLLSELIKGTVGEEAGIAFMKYLESYNFHGMNMPSYVGHEETFVFPKKADHRYIEANFESLIYYFKSEPKKYEKLTLFVSNLLFDMAFKGILMKYLAFLVSTFSRELGYTHVDFQDKCKWYDLIRYARL